MATSAYKEELIANAQFICTPGKGILAADESTGTIAKRFDNIGLENTEDNRRNYREMLLSTEGVNEFLSGVILFEETLFQNASDGRPLVDMIKANGILPGIKTDKGLGVIPETDGENFTGGLDGLADRCKRYYEQGARFSKWRNVYKIDKSKGWPSELALKENAWVLARQACISQANGLVPIIEPELMADGTHTIDCCAAVTERILSEVFKACQDQHLLWEGSILKCNMVTPGFDGPKVDPSEVAWKTVRTLRRTMPAAMPGVNFLSGGFSEQDATVNLNAMNMLDQRLRPWNLSFSYGRALQSSTLKKWNGKAENVAEAKTNFFNVCRANSQATLGQFSGAGLEAESLIVRNYVY